MTTASKRAGERSDGNGPEARFALCVVLRVEVHAHKTAIAAFAVIDGHMRGEKSPILVMLELGTDVGLAGSELSQPLAIIIRFEIELLHIVRWLQLMLGMQVRRLGSVENEIRNAAAIDHRVDVEDVRVCRVEPYKRSQGTRIKFVAVVFGIQQEAVQVAIDDTGRDPPDLQHMGTKRLEARFLRQILRDGDDRNEDGRRNKCRDPKDERIDMPSGGHGHGCGSDTREVGSLRPLKRDRFQTTLARLV